MPLRPSLLAEIQTAIGSATVPSLTTADAASDVYEAYLFSLVLEAARVEGATISLNSIEGGGPTRQFVFRTSPGFINSRNRDYGYAKIAFPSCPELEAHVGVRVSGHSGVLHECDISVLEAAEADVCRAQTEMVAPRNHKVVIAIEAKFYTTDLALHLGRAFLGLVNDTSCHNAFFVLNRDAPSVEKLLAHKKQQWEHNVIPALTVPVARLRNALQKAFHNYQARARE